MNHLHVLTGGPGAGKTALLNRLRRWIHCIDEPAREVLASERAMGGEGVPDRSPGRFVELLLQRSIEKHVEGQRRSAPVLFDRGVPDCAAYARLLGSDPARCIRATDEYRYHPIVLVMRPWAEIYTTDDERRMAFAVTLDFQRLIEAAYEEAGYTLVEVPRGDLDERASFVERAIAARAGPNAGGA